MTDEIGPRLTDEEARTLIELLARYCDHDLDQWDNWRLAMPWGNAFVTITNSLPPDWPAEVFRTVWPLPPHPTTAPHDGAVDTSE